MTRKYISNKDETVRMFESDFMEALSKVHPSVPVIIFVPVILYSLYSSIVISELSFTTIIGLAIFGLFIWSITEYALHRFVFHMKLDFACRKADSLYFSWSTSRLSKRLKEVSNASFSQVCR